MRIIICGAGSVGRAIARALKKEDKYDITVIDRDEDVVRDTCNSLDIHGIWGDCLQRETLKKAWVGTADLVVSAMGPDEDNILCGQRARLMGARHCIAVVREADHRKEGAVIPRHVGIDMFLNPDREAALDIARLLRLPAALFAETFTNGRLEMAGFRVTENDRVLLAGPLSEVMPVIGLPVLMAMVRREKEIMIPDGAFRLEAGDIVYILAHPTAVTQFFQRIGKYTGTVDRLMIVGGGETAYYLGRALQSVGMRIMIIETDEKRAAELKELLPGCDIIRGDGTNDRLLLEKHITTMGAVAALTGRDEQNLLVSMHAGRMGVSRIIARIDRRELREMAEEMGIERVVVPPRIAADRIIEYVRALDEGNENELVAMYRLADGEAEALEFVVRDDCRWAGIPLADVRLRRGTLVASIVREDTVLLPTGRDCLQVGDSVVIISNGNRVNRLNELMEEENV